MMDYRLICGDCRDVLPTIESDSVDAIIADPPYPCIQRSYGCMTEAEWHAMMRVVVPECRRVLKPTGSAVFILQPNSRKVGSMRPWLFEFQAWVCREWNMVQDVYWWNVCAYPTRHANRNFGLMRPSVKACVWLGLPECYRNQDDVLWEETQRNTAMRSESRALKYSTSGVSMRDGRCGDAAVERGGVTPFNLIPMANACGSSSAGANGHGAGTPEPLCDWWIRYLSRPGDVILDPFCGSGTVGLAALKLGRSFLGIEAILEYVDIARRRIDALTAEPTLFASHPTPSVSSEAAR
jgi:DNA modification methylase